MNPNIKNIAVLIEEHAVEFGLHIALTGGQLYKDGPRKDIDFVVYHENSEHVNGLDQSERESCVEGLFETLWAEGFSNFRNFGRVTKCTFNGIYIDILYPEYTRLGEYIVDNVSSNGDLRFPTTEDRS